MTWHYQAMRRKDDFGVEYFAIHEYFVGIEGDENQVSWTQSPVVLLAESVEDLRWMLKQMLKDLEKYEPVDYK
jgi:hypothetical protein